MIKRSLYTKGCFLEVGFFNVIQENGGRETKGFARATGLVSQKGLE